MSTDFPTVAALPSSSLPVTPVLSDSRISAITSNPDSISNPESMAVEFESVFFSLLIKNMRSSMTEEGLFGSEASDTYGGLFDLYMGQHLAKSNGLGISQMLESYSTKPN